MEDGEAGAVNTGVVIPVKEDVFSGSRTLPGFFKTMPGQFYLFSLGMDKYPLRKIFYFIIRYPLKIFKPGIRILQDVFI